MRQVEKTGVKLFRRVFRLTDPVEKLEFFKYIFRLDPPIGKLSRKQLNRKSPFLTVRKLDLASGENGRLRLTNPTVYINYPYIHETQMCEHLAIPVVEGTDIWLVPRTSFNRCLCTLRSGDSIPIFLRVLSIDII